MGCYADQPVACSCRFIKPGFRLRAEVVHNQPLSLPMQAQVALLTEQEADAITAWDPRLWFNGEQNAVRPCKVHQLHAV